jgi:hypothetical protein
MPWLSTATVSAPARAAVGNDVAVAADPDALRDAIALVTLAVDDAHSALVPAIRQALGERPPEQLVLALAIAARWLCFASAKLTFTYAADAGLTDEQAMALGDDDVRSLASGFVQAMGMALARELG